MPTVHLLIKGKVQGVFYRQTAREVAKDIGITGWVRNTPDGDVEITATGSKEALQSYIDWCHEGPAMAKVTGVQITAVDEQPFDTFEVKRG